jgi:DNA-binding protein HU-beta
MSKPMTKSDLINQIAERSELKKSDVKGVMELLATVGYKELKKNGTLPSSGLCKVYRYQEACDQRAKGD